MGREPIQVRPLHVKVPARVRAVAILWIIYGGLGIVAGLLWMLRIRWFASPVGGSMLFGAAFLATGIQTLLATPKSIRGAGIACLGIAAIGIAYVTYLGHLARFFFIAPASLLLELQSVLLVVAGVLAIVGNATYVQWRAARYPTAPR